MTRSLRAMIGAAFIGCAIAATQPARAQPVDDATRSAAATLGEAGIRLYRDGNYAAALEKFDEAERLVRAPTLGVRAARCLDKLGRLLDAANRYQTVIDMKLDASWPEVHHQAQRDARAERDALMQRIPTIELVVDAAADAQVTLDGKPLSEPRGTIAVDPGRHEISVVRRTGRWSQTVTLNERDTRRLVFPAEADRGPAPTNRGPNASVDARGGGLRRDLTWAALGVGAAGVAVFDVAGAIALAKRSDLADQCPDGRCPPSAWDENDSYDRARAISSIGFAIGVVGIATGVVLLATAPRARAAVRALQPLVGAGAF